MADSGAARSDVRRAAVRIGDWHFLPAEASLVRGEERRRLEHRAASVLETLAARRGLPVSTAELVDAVWGGRIVSPNSVAVVIADLRRALDDDARAARHIETIPKRGYRLIADPRPTVPSGEAALQPPRARRLWPAVLGLALLAALFLLFLLPRLSGPPPVTVSVAAFANDTGDPALAPLVASSQALVVTALGRLGDVRLASAPAEDGLTMRGRLILWQGHPALALSAEDRRAHRIVWTGMASGPEAAFPRQVPQQIGAFDASLNRRPSS